MNMNTAGAPKEFISTEALKRNIPIYIVKYPLNGDFSRKDIEGIEKITYGELIVPSNTRDDYHTALSLSKAYRDMSVRHYGQDYKVTFTSIGKRNGKSHNIILSINGIEHKITYNSPDFSLQIWMQENVGLAIAIGCAVILLIVLIIFLIVYKSRKRKEKDLALQMKNEQLQAQMDEQQKQKVMNAIKEVSQIDQGEQLDSTPDIGKSSGNGYTEMGKVYKDKDTGKLIMVEG
jgi:hypothetical protein